jgi:hypothetical protein
VGGGVCLTRSQGQSQKCESPGRNNLPRSQAFRFYCEELALLAEGDDAEGAATVVVLAGGEKELIGIDVEE